MKKNEAMASMPAQRTAFSFVDSQEMFLTDVSYQRKVVWSTRTQQNFIDSLIRQYPIPAVVLREVITNDQNSKFEVLDGKQRVTSIVNMFNSKIPIPESLKDIYPEIASKFYKDITKENQQFLKTQIYILTQNVTAINDIKNLDHQRTAIDLFKRMQQSTKTSLIEELHAELFSISRNFIVKYASEDIYDITELKSIKNEHCHDFFKIINRKDDRMQGLLLMAKLALLEEKGEITTVSDKKIKEFIIDNIQKDGAENYDYERRESARKCIKTLDLMSEIFRDATRKKEGQIKNLDTESVIISFYLLIRFLNDNYILDRDATEALLEFYNEFYDSFKTKKIKDKYIGIFASSTQLNENRMLIRDAIIKMFFFKFMKERGYTLSQTNGTAMGNEYEAIKGFIDRQTSGDYKKAKWIEYCESILKNPENDATNNI